MLLCCIHKNCVPPIKITGFVVDVQLYITIQDDVTPLFCYMTTCWLFTVDSWFAAAIPKDDPGIDPLTKPRIYNPCVISENNLVVPPPVVNPILPWLIVAAAI